MTKELLFSITKKDLKIQTFRSGGKGGQHQNKTDSGVRIIHIESGATGESRSFKSQYQNKKEALRRLSKNPKFKLWITRKVHELKSKKTIEERVEEEMHLSKLKIECKNEEGKWDICLFNNIEDINET